MKIIRAKRNRGEILQERIKQGLPVLSFPSLEKCHEVEHVFTTRLGGVSEGIYSSLNVSFQRGDNADAVLENYKRVANAMGCGVEDMVSTRQTHTTNIRVVTKKDKGKGIIKPADYEDVDGLITKEAGVALVALYADCVPIYFVDPKNLAIGLAHSGWRGTVAGMGEKMVEAMSAEFGSRPEQLLVAIGPSICKECYEVDTPVAEPFMEALQGTEAFWEEICKDSDYFSDKEYGWKPITEGKSAGKYQLDLWLSNLLILRRAGIPLKNIAVTDICTCHNPNYLFSHRASKGKRGNLGAFLMLKKN